ncbi:MAG: SIMPL domain-containing protein [Akkermansiaceae bacterium]
MKEGKCLTLLPAALIAAGIALAGYFASQTLYNAKVALNTAEAKGLAERRVTADRANWTVYFQVSGKSRDDVPQLYKDAERQQGVIMQLLKDEGLPENEMKTGIIDYSSKEYRDEDQKIVDEKHWLTGSISVETENVEIIEKLRGSVNKLIAQGYDITNRPASYHFTKLNDVKPEMLKEAAKNARIAANEFADNAGVKVGRIRSATQGAFFVVDIGESHGDTRKIEKNVRVVTRIEFYLSK